MSTANSAHRQGPGVADRRGIARAAGVIALATLLSRILGFARDVLIARTFGTQFAAQAFVVAFRIPNLLRDFLAEGASNAALVPVFTEYRARRTAQEFWELTQAVLSALLVILSVVTLAGILAAPLLVRLAAPGFAASPEKLDLTIALTRGIFPYLMLVSLAAFAMGVLNSLKHFTAAAFAPCFLNIALIVCILWSGADVTGLACGVLIGGLLQLIVQVPALFRRGFRLRFVPRWRKHPGVVSIRRLIVPRILSSGIYQLNSFVDSIFGSLAWIVGEGGVVVLYFAYHLILFPLGIFSTALAQAILPAFSSQAAHGDEEGLAATLSWGIRATFFVLLPASAGLIVLAQPLVSGVFGGGKFDTTAASSTAAVLACYSIGLFAYGGSRILQSCFFALKDTRTPAKVAALALVMNVVLNLALIARLQLRGIAIATAASGIVSFIMLFFLLAARLRNIRRDEVAGAFVRILSASVCAGLAGYVFYYRVLPQAAGRAALLTNLGMTAGLCLGAYAFFCAVFGVRELRQFAAWVRQRGRR